MRRLVGIVGLVVVALIGQYVIQASAQVSGGGVSLYSHSTARGVYVQHANALYVQIVGPDGRPASVNASNQLATSASASVTVDTISHITSSTHIVGSVKVVAQDGTVATLTGTSLNVNCTAGCSGGQQTPVNQMGVWTIQAAHQGGVWTVSHVTSVMHVIGSMQVISQAGAVATLTGTSLDVNCTAGCSGGVQTPVNQMGVWTIQAAHQGGVWTTAHVSSVVHVAAASPIPVVPSPQQGPWPVTAHAGTGSLTVNQGGTWVTNAHQAGAWNIDKVSHVTSAMAHVIGTVTVEGRGSAGTSTGGVVTVQGVSGGTGLPVSNVAHVTSTLHVSGSIRANLGTGDFTCHSTASFAMSASGIIAHAAGSNRIFICSIVIVTSAAQSASLVEGTGSLCGTNTAPVIGSTTSTEGLAMAANGGFTSIAPFPWIATATAGNNVCLLLSGGGRASGSMTYRGVP